MKANRGLVWVILGIALVLVGGLWTLQGVGVIGGSVMSGSMTWAVIGPIVVIVGLAIVVRWARASRT